MSVVAVLVWLAAEAAAGLLVPWMVVRAAVRSLGSRGVTVPNWRGEAVVRALGVAWFVWAGAVAVLAAGWGVLGGFAGPEELLADALFTAAAAPVFAAPLFLVAGIFALGLFDDAFGDATSRGIRGHLRALARGEFTTGTLKLAGIGALAFVQTSALAFDNGIGAGTVLLTWSLATVTVSGAANAVNLLDLRPGRALKGYGLLIALACVAMGLDARQGWASPAAAWTAAVSLGVLLAGPLLASWRLDVRRHAMLGDAGANAAGALAGYFLALALPLPMLAVAAAALVAVNLAAEKVSFTDVIERNAVLRALDGLGVSGDRDVGL